MIRINLQFARRGKEGKLYGIVGPKIHLFLHASVRRALLMRRNFGLVSLSRAEKKTKHRFD